MGALRQHDWLPQHGRRNAMRSTNTTGRRQHGHRVSGWLRTSRPAATTSTSAMQESRQRTTPSASARRTRRPATFIAGIRGVTTGSANAVAVLIDSSGQLGTASSSRRVKDDIADMGGASARADEPAPRHVQLQERPEPVRPHAPVRADRRGGGRSLPGPGRAFRRRPDRNRDVPVPAADAAERSTRSSSARSTR